MNKGVPEQIIAAHVLVNNKQFMVKIAENQGEVEKALRLRYEVFNLEQGKGLKNSEENGIDSDEFDESCLHLLVLEKGADRVIGTYRAYFGFLARSMQDFYSSREYDIKGLDRIAEKCVELGRSCVSPEYRTGVVVSLLWSAISELLIRGNLKYMIGCASLEETDPRIGWALYTHLNETHSLHDGITAIPRPGFELEKVSEDEVKKVLMDKTIIQKCIPPLFKGYLRIGAVICGEPAMDSEFGTIDFFILVDIDKVPDRYLRYFNYLKSSD